MPDSSVLEETRRHHQLVIAMLKHHSDEMHEKLDRLLAEVGKMDKEQASEEKWFKTLAFQAAKIYGEEHDLTKHYRSIYKLETGKEWQED